VPTAFRLPGKRSYKIDGTSPNLIADLQEVLIPSEQFVQVASGDLVAGTQPDPVPVGHRLRPVSLSLTIKGPTSLPV